MKITACYWIATSTKTQCNTNIQLTTIALSKRKIVVTFNLQNY